MAAAVPRAVREPGRRMRSQLLDAAAALFKSNGLSGTSVADIAQAGNAFPSQVTYYFHTKEALFVETACREVLYVAQRAEEAAATARTLDAYIDALVSQVVSADGLAMFIEALALARRRQDLAPLIARTVERLHTEGARAYDDVRARRGWAVSDDPPLRARRFWALVLGVVLSSTATGAPQGHARNAILELLRAEWQARTGGGAPQARASAGAPARIQARPRAVRAPSA
jgi:AcrR family transcriptional regulator